uniref:ATP-binding cassette domain-containing protein n=1 Tax=Staphylothermus marinus TaxID=2280 RepID=A0A7C4D8H9_STAMA
MPIILREVYASYRGSRWVLNNISMNIDKNTVILGPNGSGKTTLFRVILGLSVKTRGEILIDGVDVDSIKGKPGLISTNLPSILMGFRVKTREIAKLYLDVMDGDYDYFNSLISEFGVTEILDKKFHELSTGSKVLFLNALALAGKSKYILLDEPFESVDPARRVILLKKIVESSSIMILNTHLTWLLKYIPEWDSYIIVQGRSAGPLSVSELLESKISREKTVDTIIELSIRDEKIYLTKNSGMPLSDLDSLDKLFEVIIG